MVIFIKCCSFPKGKKLILCRYYYVLIGHPSAGKENKQNTYKVRVYLGKASTKTIGYKIN